MLHARTVKNGPSGLWQIIAKQREVEVVRHKDHIKEEVGRSWFRMAQDRQVDTSRRDTERSMSKKGWKKAGEEETLSGPIFKSISRLSGSSRQNTIFFHFKSKGNFFQKPRLSLSSIFFLYI